MSWLEGSTLAPSVLIVDDELGRRESLRMVLQPLFQVATAGSGEQALGLLRRRQVDVVTLDLMIAGLGGIETFEKIREMDGGGSAFVVVLPCPPRADVPVIARSFGSGVV